MGGTFASPARNEGAMSLPYFPMYPSDFEADTSHLSLAEDGAYNRLLRLMWMTPGCSLPDDPAWITRRLRVSAGDFQSIVAPLLDEFFKRSGGRVYSPRLRREWEKVDETSRRRSEAGKKGGRPKDTEKKAQSEKPGFDFDKAGPKQPEPEPEPYKNTEAKASVVRLATDHSSECVERFNRIAARVGWPSVQRLTPPRKAALSHRIADCGGVDEWCEAMERAARSPLLTGQAGRGWLANFDWLLKPANFTKLMEGNYDPSTRDTGQAGRSGMVDAFAAVAAARSGRA
jgi:uncharacterized protein YdaU (DUF1376 family)